MSAFDWSPDGGSLAFIARVPEKGRYGSVEGLDASAEPPRHITGVRWHANGLGYLADRPAHVFVVPAPTTDAEPFYEPAATVRGEDETAPKKKLISADPRRLTEGSLSHAGVTFAGNEILTVPDDPAEERPDLRSRLIAVSLDGGGAREIVGRDANLSISEVAIADDSTVALLAADVGPNGIDFVAPGVALWVVETDGPRRAHRTEPSRRSAQARRPAASSRPSNSKSPGATATPFTGGSRRRTARGRSRSFCRSMADRMRPTAYTCSTRRRCCRKQATPWCTAIRAAQRATGERMVAASAGGWARWT